jgi:YbgC/YbaW family acyl-CoA thioester hydrolase
MPAHHSTPVFETEVQVRSYELDGFGHLNHAVFLNYFEFARFQALEAGGFSSALLAARGEGVHVVRVEVDYRREALLHQVLAIRTRVVGSRTSSLTLHQEAFDPRRPDEVFAEGRVVVVWVGADRRPMRIPDDVREALGLGSPSS